MGGMFFMNKTVKFSELEKRIKYKFKDENYLKNALTHTSFANEKKLGKLSSYERIEFLGDSILNTVISEYLFVKYPNLPEGELTRNRSNVVCEQTLAKCARNLGIGAFILLGKGEANTGGFDRESILADVFESITGAIYLDGGYDAAKAFILSNIEIYIFESIKGSTMMDYKTLLQELVQKTDAKIEYKIVHEEGPDHDKIFISQIIIAGNISGEGKGKGKTKKEAEQNAAKEAYKFFI
jgi:ribonuclease-3